MTQRRFTIEDYTVGWVCALPIELAAAKKLLDEKHPDPPQDTNDTNLYTLGRIGRHNVVVACLPAGLMGTSSAAAVAMQMKAKFKTIRFGLMVGIGGGVPSAGIDIRLGDVVVSQPHKGHVGVVQYDFGKTRHDGFERTGFLNAPPTVLLNALTVLQANYLTGESKLSEYLSTLSDRPIFARDKTGPDDLFESNYTHIGGDTCEWCSKERLVKRTSRTEDVVIHFGTIASGNQVMRDAAVRDRLSAELDGVLCFEMEAAGLMNNFPCLVIRGISDYADSHKNKIWQGYAAATAAACAKEILSVIPPGEIETIPMVDDAEKLQSDNRHALNRRQGNRSPSTCNIGCTESNCLKDLRLTDPRDDMTRIKQTKGSLLQGSYTWIFDHRDFQRWRAGKQSQLLWIEGGPGKGKTMLLIGIINDLMRQAADAGEGHLKLGPARKKKVKELNTSTGNARILSFFFCQANDLRLNSATAVLRGLIYLLIKQQESLISYLRKAYDNVGGQLFEGTNAFAALSRIFKDMLQDQTLTSAILIIDALDECETGLPQLLDFITEAASSRCHHVKWIVSSRGRSDIEQRLTFGGICMRLSLDLNVTHISHAIDVYIDHNISKLTSIKDDTSLQNQVRDQMRRKADGTFLWVALVFKELQEVLGGEVLQVLKEVPNDLTLLYDRMLEQIHELNPRHQGFCCNILSIATLAYRPLHLLELRFITGLESEISRMADFRRTINLCGSFLTIIGDHVYLIHQSAKTYLSAKSVSDRTLLRHFDMFSRSIAAMSKTLRRDMYKIQHPGHLINQIKPIDPDLLVPAHYCCVYWVDHLCEDSSSFWLKRVLTDNGSVFEFLKLHFLHWFECLAVFGMISEGTVMIRKLLRVVVQDAQDFALRYGSIIERAPLQLYAAALVFSPVNSEIKTHFWDERLPYIKNVKGVKESWDAYQQTLRGHSGMVLAVAFSPSGNMLASASNDWTVRLWDPATGTCKKTLEGHSSWVTAVAFSPNGQWLASASNDRTVRLWNIDRGVCERTLKGHSGWVIAVAFSSDSRQPGSATDDRIVQLWDGWRLVSAFPDKRVRFWDTAIGAYERTLKGHGSIVTSVAISSDSRQLASASYDGTVWLWDAARGVCEQTLEGHSSRVTAVVFSADGQQLASASQDRSVRLWDTAMGTCKQILEGHSSSVTAVAFSPDSRQLASASQDISVRLWNTVTGACKQILRDHSTWITAIAFSPNCQQLVSASQDGIVTLWDTATGTQDHTLRGNSGLFQAMAFSPDGQRLASASECGTVRLWDAAMGIWERTLTGRTGTQTFKGHRCPVIAVVFSPDGRWLASASEDRDVRIWDVATGTCEQILEGHISRATAMTFSSDSQQLASGSTDWTIRLWNTATGACEQILKDHRSWITAMAFSPNCQQLASASQDGTVRLWDAATGARDHILQGHKGTVKALAFSPDGQRLASASEDGTVYLWNMVTGEGEQILKDYCCWVTALAISPDSRQLAIASDDRKVRLWNKATGKCERILDVHTVIQSLLFSTDGQYLKTDRGVLAFDSNLSGILFLKEDWVSQDGKDILRLPRDDRVTCSTIYNNILVCGHSSGQVAFVEFASSHLDMMIDNAVVTARLSG